MTDLAYFATRAATLARPMSTMTVNFVTPHAAIYSGKVWHPQEYIQNRN
jgi:hypothetical protein